MKESDFTTHERGYYITDVELIGGVCEKSIVESIISIFDLETVVDIGCGAGRHTEQLLDAGIQCIGYDGNPLTPELTNGICKVLDFSKPVDIGLFDLVLSLETGEHIPKKYEEIFIDNLCRATEKTIVLSWAFEGMVWPGHVNCQNNDYVISEMAKRKFIFDADSTEYIRSKVTGWLHFKHTLMAFIKEKND